jgi:hypothetical protein
MSDRQALIATMRAVAEDFDRLSLDAECGEYFKRRARNGRDALREAAAALEQGTPRELRAITEQSCGECDYDEADGGLMNHCNKCCRKITTEAYALAHAGPPLPREPQRDEDTRDLDRACANATARVEAIKARRRARDEDARLRKASAAVWAMIDPMRPSGQPGSYARGEYNGIVAAARTLDAAIAEQERGGKP